MYIANLHEKACISFTSLYIQRKEGYTFMLLALTVMGKPGYGS